MNNTKNQQFPATRIPLRPTVPMGVRPSGPEPKPRCCARAFKPAGSSHSALKARRTPILLLASSDPKMRKRLFFSSGLPILAVLLLLLAASPVSTSELDDWDNLRLLVAGEKITVVRMSLKTQQGIFLAYSENNLTSWVEGREMVLPRTEVFRVTSREEDHRKRNKFIGALIGLGAGIAVGTIMDAQRVDISILPTGFLGLAIGGGIGALIPSHPTIYRAMSTSGTSGNPTSHNRQPPSSGYFPLTKPSLDFPPPDILARQNLEGENRE